MRVCASPSRLHLLWQLSKGRSDPFRTTNRTNRTNRPSVCFERVLLIHVAMDQCSVCLEDNDGRRDEHTLACSHRFHSACLLPWLLAGNRSCPSCRADTNDGSAGPSIPMMSLYARASYLRGIVARRRDAPRDLVALVKRVRRAEEKYRCVSREGTDHNRAHKPVITQAVRLRRRRWTAAQRVRHLKRMIGSFSCPAYPLPALAVST